MNETVPAPTPAPPAPAPTVRPTWPGSNPRTTIMVGAVAILIGSPLPWVTASIGYFSVTKSGLEGDGVFTLGAAGILLLLGVSARFAQRWVLCGAVAAATTAVALWSLVRISDATTDEIAVVPGVGLWMVAGGAIVALVGAWQAKPASTFKPTITTPPTDHKTVDTGWW